MILPEKAEVKQLSDVEPGSLVLWNIKEEENVFAVCFNKEEDGETTKCMAVLNAPDNGRPYFVRKQSVYVLDLGKSWFADVDITDSVPDLAGISEGVLCRCGAGYFLRVTQGGPFGGGYVDLEKGDFCSELPANKNARWDDFAILFAQQHGGEPVQVFRWSKNGIV